MERMNEKEIKQLWVKAAEVCAITERLWNAKIEGHNAFVNALKNQQLIQKYYDRDEFNNKVKQIENGNTKAENVLWQMMKNIFRQTFISVKHTLTRIGKDNRTDIDCRLVAAVVNRALNFSWLTTASDDDITEFAQEATRVLSLYHGRRYNPDKDDFFELKVIERRLCLHGDVFTRLLEAEIVAEESSKEAV